MIDNDNKEKNFISAVVYIHNAEKTLEVFLRGLNEYLKNIFLKYEIICVNDASVDSSKDIIKRMYKDEDMGTISILNMSYFQGLELSMCAGVDLAIGDFIYEFDNTVLSFGNEMFEKIYRRCLEGVDIVSACPYDKGYRLSSYFYQIYNSHSSSQYKIRTESFRILSRRAVNRVQVMSKTIPYRKAVYANCGLPTEAIYYERIIELPVVGTEERNVQKKIAVDALILYTNIAYKYSVIFSGIMMAVTLFMAIYAFITYYFIRPVAGWTTTILFLSFCSFGISTLLTILIKYAELILKIVFNRQKYVIESIEKTNK